MKNKILISLIALFAVCILFSAAYATWIYGDSANVVNTVQVEVPVWNFMDLDFAKVDNLRSSTNINVSKEETITQNSSEAIRITSTTGTSTKDHTIHINFDRDYYLSEIQFYKFEFDYYHRYKREQYNKGFPTVQFMINNSTLGTNQGGTDNCTEKSSFVATSINDDWWHLEYYIFAHLPTIAKHSDTPIGLDKKINGVRITDRTMYDFEGVTAFAVIDNMSFSPEPAPRLGIFNRWTNDTAGKWFWFKIAFSGELHSVKLSSSDNNIAIPEFDPDDEVSTSAPFPNGSPFYFKLLQPGTVKFTAVVEVGDNYEVFTITSDTFTVN